MQHVDFHTRARGVDEPHLLDLVITNTPIDKIIELAPLGKSDHVVLLITPPLVGGTGYCNPAISLFICFFVSKITRTRLD